MQCTALLCCAASYMKRILIMRSRCTPQRGTHLSPLPFSPLAAASCTHLWGEALASILLIVCHATVLEVMPSLCCRQGRCWWVSGVLGRTAATWGAQSACSLVSLWQWCWSMAVVLVYGSGAGLWQWRWSMAVVLVYGSGTGLQALLVGGWRAAAASRSRMCS